MNRPQPPRPAPTSEDRNWGMAAHLSALVMIVGVPAVVGPLIVWIVKRDQPFVSEHGREALNFNISMLIYGAALVVFGIVTLGIGLLLVLPAAFALLIAWLVLLVQGAMAAARGDRYRYPLSIRLIQ